MKEQYKKGKTVTTIDYSPESNVYFCDLPRTGIFKSKNELIKLLKSIGFKKVKYSY